MRLIRPGSLSEILRYEFPSMAIHRHRSKRERQRLSHSVTFTPDMSLLVCADLGTDRLHVFPLNGSGRRTWWMPMDDRRGLKPHSGPRHIVYSERGTGYLINEISGEVTVLERRGDSFEPVQYIASDTVGGHGSGEYSSVARRTVSIHIQSSEGRRHSGVCHRFGNRTAHPHRLWPQDLIRQLRVVARRPMAACGLSRQ